LEIIASGKIKAVCISEQRGTVKAPVACATLKKNYGVESDAHAGDWHRQVSLLGADAVAAFEKDTGTKVEPGAFGENILVEGFDPSKLPAGSTLKIGQAVLEITQLGKECHTSCNIKKMTGKCIMPVYGVFARVNEDGQIKHGDEITAFEPDLHRPYQAAVITVSDKGSKGEREDKSGPLAKSILEQSGYEVTETLIIPDEKEIIKRELIRLSDKRGMDVIFTSGGTGFAKRDVTPEATDEVCDKRVPGIPEAIRMNSMKFTDHALLSRQSAGIRGNTLIINLPGSPKAVKEDLEFILPKIRHGINILRGIDKECAGGVK
jgi:molybdenum cofactor synthesis domain